MSWTVKQVRSRLRKRDLGGAFSVLDWVARERFFEWRYSMRSSEIIKAAELGTDLTLSEDHESTGYLILHKVLRDVHPVEACEIQVFLYVASVMGRSALVAAHHLYA